MKSVYFWSMATHFKFRYDYVANKYCSERLLLCWLWVLVGARTLLKARVVCLVLTLPRALQLPDGRHPDRAPWQWISTSSAPASGSSPKSWIDKVYQFNAIFFLLQRVKKILEHYYEQCFGSGSRSGSGSEVTFDSVNRKFKKKIFFSLLKLGWTITKYDKDNNRSIIPCK